MLAAAPSAAATQASEPPRIGKPRPAPPTAPNVAPLPPAAIDNNLAIGGQDLKAREVDTRLSVDVDVNGSGPYHFMVDSGADSSAIGIGVAHALDLPLGTPAVVNSTTGRNVVDRVKVRELTVGPTSIRNVELPALREADLGGDGLIGIDALAQQRLMMDFEKRVIRVEDTRTPIEILPGDIVITAHRRRGQLILTQVRAGGIRLNAIIDTGSEVTIGNSALRDKLLRRNPNQFWTVAATGVTGQTVQLQMAKVSELVLGPVTLNDVPIAFADVPPFKLFGLADQPALLLGTDLLETFRRVSLDFSSRKVRFQLRRCQQDGVIISTAPPDMFSRVSSNAGGAICER
jgi:hypothetical protein